MYFFKKLQTADILEIRSEDGSLVGVILPTNKGIKIVSKEIADSVDKNIKIDRSPPAPTIIINF
ncbi:hypothetical protein JW698_03045 [Candidatus Wolfebacteria bacterium]|nr:hypothetical protein [Candidatus Wolfebacteria bacterium]